MLRRTTFLGRLAALSAVAALVAAGCGNSTTGPSSVAGPGQTDGVKPHEIDVGSLVAVTGPLGGVYNNFTHGVKAYFNLINAEGGVNGRTLKMTKVRDDQTDPTRSVVQAQSLVNEDHVFAVFASSPVFNGGEFLASKSVPTFGTNFNTQWDAGPSLFGHDGSFNDPTRPGPFLPWLAKEVGATSAATIAYTVAESADCGAGEANSFTHFGVNLGLKDVSLAFGATDVTADINLIKEHHVGFVGTCMDPTGNTLVYRGLQAAGLTNVKMEWPNGYDQATLQSFADEMQGVYFGLQHVPFEDINSSPEMQLYAKELDATYPGEALGEESLYGWEMAELFVDGLKRIGPNVTRKRLIDSLNQITNFTANGLVPPIDWSVQHTQTGHYDCTAVVQVKGNKFVPVFGSATSPYVCFAPNTTTLDTIVPPNFLTGVTPETLPPALLTTLPPGETTTTIDETAVKAAITTSFVNFFNSANTNQTARLALLQGGSGVANLVNTLFANNAKIGSYVKVTNITLLSSDDCASNGLDPQCATVTYDLYIAASPNKATLPGSTGYATFEGGVWKVARQTFCALSALDNQKCPAT
jgi:ABC-type branched-subunit amino acid transport system substrate-binding protein